MLELCYRVGKNPLYKSPPFDTLGYVASLLYIKKGEKNQCNCIKFLLTLYPVYDILLLSRGKEVEKMNKFGLTESDIYILEKLVKKVLDND